MSATAACRALVENLLDAGVREAVIAPGSRSGPLAIALADADRSGALRLHVRVDERTAGFLALGLAKASRSWVPVVTTSGTASANLHPALLEARHARVRLLAVTADRPARLRGTGANQTTDQVELFSGISFGDDPPGVAALLTTADGPAHLNLELDEPLVEAGAWAPSARPTEPRGGPSVPLDGPELEMRPHAVVVAGDDCGPRARVFAEQAGLPLLAEPSSGARTGDHALITYRLLLEHAPIADQIDQVVVFGHSTLSRQVTSLLARTDVDVVVPARDLRRFPLPPGHARLVDPHVVPSTVAAPTWLDAWRTADAMASAAVDVESARHPAGAALEVARAVHDAVPPEGLLVVGSSNPIRDLDVVARPYTVGERRLVLSNRGLSGIDGTLSTAIGAALARTSSRAIAYVGDLTFLHDANALMIGPGEPRPDLTIVVASDDGGSIFATLEQGGPEFADVFERVYATPTRADIGGVCAAFGVPHRLLSATDLPAALDEVVTGIRVLEVPIPRDSRRDLAAVISAAVRVAAGP
ncbi:2-succinyl-5-enolpyruvyl-6-hydroxy-3-cyclohexene-1-carboxylate synthase [Aeromicrobium sp.]|uniref:2-succinyl-5-enolpyruvyl-6-hydroxy-3- cyclohexene-1-carboxylate synthase n=1 Tax=Aeromicrobium sp. TaxID=1871063 RepID=UPI003D6BDBDF